MYSRILVAAEYWLYCGKILVFNIGFSMAKYYKLNMYFAYKLQIIPTATVKTISRLSKFFHNGNSAFNNYLEVWALIAILWSSKAIHINVILNNANNSLRLCKTFPNYSTFFYVCYLIAKQLLLDMSQKIVALPNLNLILSTSYYFLLGD